MVPSGCRVCGRGYRQVAWTYARGNGWVDKWAYYEGNGSSYLYVECRILDTEVHTFGYTY